MDLLNLSEHTELKPIKRLAFINFRVNFDRCAPWSHLSLFCFVFYIKKQINNQKFSAQDPLTAKFG